MTTAFKPHIQSPARLAVIRNEIDIYYAEKVKQRKEFWRLFGDHKEFMI